MVVTLDAEFGFYAFLVAISAGAIAFFGSFAVVWNKPTWQPVPGLVLFFAGVVGALICDSVRSCEGFATECPSDTKRIPLHRV